MHFLEYFPQVSKLFQRFRQRFNLLHDRSHALQRLLRFLNCLGGFLQCLFYLAQRVLRSL